MTTTTPSFALGWRSILLLLSCLHWIPTSGFHSILPHHRTTLSRTSATARPDSSLYSLPFSPQSIAQQVQPSVVLVIPTSVRNTTARGSGFVIQHDNATYVVTSSHVALPGYQLFLQASGGDEGSRIPAQVVVRDVEADLALLMTQAVAMPSTVIPLVPANATPPVGSWALAHGFPASRLITGPAMTLGIVCGIAQGLGMPDGLSTVSTSNNNHTQYVVTDAALSGGMSGGPLVNERGEVIGINALIRPDLRALGNYAVSVQELQRLLQELPLSSDSRNLNGSSPPLVFGVYLYNDPRNKRERVAQVLRDVAELNDTLATEIMMQAHTSGRGLVAQRGSLEEASALCERLRQEDLLLEVQAL